MTPKVSVIIPVYQVERYLAESLQSVQNQSLREIEILFVDDGSSDGCVDMLDEAAAGDSRIHVFHNENHGYGYSVNYGFRHARGEYLAIFEPDDVMPLHALEQLYTLAVRHGVDLVKGDYCELRIGPAGERLLVPARLHPNESLYGRVFNALERPEALVSQICVWGSLFRRDLIERYKIRLSETPGASFQDVSLFFPLLLRSRTTFYTHQITYLYRNDNPAASTKSRGKLYFAEQEYIRALDYLKGVSDDERLRAALWCARWRGALGTLSRVDPALYHEFLDYLRPLIEAAFQDKCLRRAYCSAYQWAMLLRFLRGNGVFLRALGLSNGKHRNPVRLLWRFRYDGIPDTLLFIKRKRGMQASVKSLQGDDLLSSPLTGKST